jgi:hypothetical protein
MSWRDQRDSIAYQHLKRYRHPTDVELSVRDSLRPGCQRNSRRSKRPMRAPTAKTQPARTTIPAKTPVVSNTPSAWAIR